MNLLPTFALLGLVASTFGAPKANYPINLYKKALQENQQEFNIGRSSNYFGSDYNQYPSQFGSAFNFPNQPFQVRRARRSPKANYPINLFKKALQESDSTSQQQNFGYQNQQQFNTGRSSNFVGSDFNQYSSQSGSAFNFPNQPFQVGRAIGKPAPGGNNPPLGLTVDFTSSFGSFPLGSRNELTPEQRKVLIPVFDSLVRVMESNKPNVKDVNTLMKAVRNLLKTVPDQPTPNLRQFGFDMDSLRTSMGIDLETLKSVALPATGDIAITENGQDKIITTFGTFPLEPLMTKAEREQFLPAVKSFAKLLRQDFLNPTETEELLSQVRKLDSWNLFAFDIRPSNEPRKKTGSGTTFNIGALGSLISGLVNSQMSQNFA